VIEIKHNSVENSTHTYSLSEEGFGYNYGRLKSSVSHASRENTLLRCGKIAKRIMGVCSELSMGAAYWLVGGRCACLFIACL